MQGLDDGSSHLEGLQKDFGAENKPPTTMKDEQYEELDENTLSIIQLCITTMFPVKFLSKQPL